MVVICIRRLISVHSDSNSVPITYVTEYVYTGYIKKSFKALIKRQIIQLNMGELPEYFCKENT